MTMADSFDFPDAEIFWPGAEGPPGKRVFFLTGGADGELVYLRCEKQQVAALGEYLLALLDDLSPDVEPAEGHGDVTPLPFQWDVGSIGVKYEEPEDRIVVVLEEVVTGEPTEEPADEASTAADEAQPATARFCFTLPQAAAFAQFALDLVAQGRPDCGFCGLPIDPEGHVCPRMN
jgi:uncharacterized repeat protein (TIGR03847 family)